MTDPLVLFNSFTLLSLVKVMIVVLLAVYAAFAYLMMSQIGSMIRAVRIKDDYIIKYLGLAHFIAAIVVLFIALIVL